MLIECTHLRPNSSKGTALVLSTQMAPLPVVSQGAVSTQAFRYSRAPLGTGWDSLPPPASVPAWRREVEVQ